MIWYVHVVKKPCGDRRGKGLQVNDKVTLLMVNVTKKRL